MRIRAFNKKLNRAALVQIWAFSRESMGRMLPGRLTMEGGEVWPEQDVSIQIESTPGRYIDINLLIETFNLVELSKYPREETSTTEGKWESTLDSEQKKLCPKCNKEKLTSEFYRDRSRPDGLARYCRECQRKKA